MSWEKTRVRMKLEVTTEERQGRQVQGQLWGQASDNRGAGRGQAKPQTLCRDWGACSSQKGALPS